MKKDVGFSSMLLWCYITLFKRISSGTYLGGEGLVENDLSS